MLGKLTQQLAILAQPLSVTIVLVYLYGYVGRSILGKHRQNLAMGIVFGLASAYAMQAPFVVAEGVIVDIRNLLVGVSGAFFGPIGAVVTAVLAGAMRIWLGGAGMMSGIAAIAVAAVAGLAWRHWMSERPFSQWITLPLLGLLISLHNVTAVMLPRDLVWTYFTQVAPVLSLINTVGAILLAKLIEREKFLHLETQILTEAAATDPLTRLLNRRSAVKAFSALSPPKAQQYGTAMLCFDIDRFKSINDTHGHLRGDQVLVEISQRVASCLRPTDIFSRIGGDEFLIALPNVSKVELDVIAERCRSVVSASPIDAHGVKIATTISIGANWSQDLHEFSQFLLNADEALYQAKAMGRNCVAVAIQSLATPTAQARLAMR